MAKKNKKNIAKRQAKAGERKTQKRKLRLVKARKQQRQKSFEPDFGYPPPGYGPPHMTDMEAPDGFRAVGMSEALMLFTNELIKHPDLKGLDSMQDVYNLAMPLWNYTITQEHGEDTEKLRSMIIKALVSTCKISQEEAGLLLDKAVARKNEMFPPDVQPQGTVTMFMRKENLHLITPFNYNRLTVSAEVIPVNDKDQRFFDQLAALDEIKKEADDFDEWQKQYEVVRESFGEIFWGWLTAKDVDEDLANEFTFRAEFFINFIYNYGSADILQNTDYSCLDEFFYDFVLRKIMLDPWEHVEWVPALRLLFTFLAEKGYVEEAEPFVKAIDSFEEPFLSLLRKEYG